MSTSIPPLPDRAPESAPAIHASIAKRPSLWRNRRFLIIVGAVLALLVVGGIATAFIVQNFLRGGASSPQAAVDEFITAVEAKDQVGMYRMMDPTERDGLREVSDTLIERFSSFDIPQAVSKAYGTDPQAAELSLDGVNISLEGTEFQEDALGENFAQITLTGGQLSFQVTTGETRGLLRTALDATQTSQDINETTELADSNLTFVVSKVNGGWYVSPMLSAVGTFNASITTGGTGNIQTFTTPAESPPGSASPSEAAQEFMGSLQAAGQMNDLVRLAQALSNSESALLQMFPALTGSASVVADFSLESNSFVDGPRRGSAGIAWADDLSYTVDGYTYKVSGKCYETTDESATFPEGCITGSGYWFGPSPAGNPWSAGSIDGNYGVAAVEENGGWKFSILRTATSMYTSWLNSLTKEQMYAMMSLDQTSDPQGSLESGPSQVNFNNAGYAVRELSVSEPTELEVLIPGTATEKLSVFSTDNLSEDLAQSSGFDFGSNSELSTGSSVDLEAGDYIVVLRDNSPWPQEAETADEEMFSADSFQGDIEVSLTPISGN